MEGDSVIELTQISVHPGGHVGLEWINHSGEKMGYLEVATDPEFRTVSDTLRFSYGQAGFFLPDGEHFFLRLGSLNKLTNRGGGPWSKTLEVRKSTGGYQLVSGVAPPTMANPVVVPLETPPQQLVRVDENSITQRNDEEPQAKATTPEPPVSPAAMGPRIRLVLRTQTQGELLVQNGGLYFLGTWSAGQVFEGNYFDVTNDGDSPLTLIAQKNGKYLGVTGDGMVRTYNYGDIGKAPIPPQSERQGATPSLGLSLGTMDSKPGTHHQAQLTLTTNDPVTPVLSFSVLFDLAAPGPTLEVRQSTEHFRKALVPTWSAVKAATKYELVRQLPGATTAYEVVYTGTALSYEDMGLDAVGVDRQVHYFVRALLDNDNSTAWSWQSWASFPQLDLLDPYEYGSGGQTDGVFETATPIQLGEKQIHSLYPLEDNDWLWFEAKKGATYQIRVAPTEAEMTLKFHLEAGLLPQKLNGPYYEATAKRPVILNWKAQDNGKAWIRLRGRAAMASPSPAYSIALVKKD